MPPDNPDQTIEKMDYSGGALRFQLAPLICIGPFHHTETVITNLRCCVVLMDTNEKAIQLSDALLILI